MLEKEINFIREISCNKLKTQSYAKERLIKLPKRGVAKKEEEPKVPEPKDSMA
jgi:hypothetical protein